MEGSTTAERRGDEVPVHRVGDGDTALLVIPGVEDVLFGNWTPRRVRRRLLSWDLRAFRRTHTAHVAGLPRSLPPETTVADLAETYARVLDGVDGAADVVGHSLGGCVALELAFRHPERVDHLVLAGAGYAPGTDGRRALDRWAARAAAGDVAGLRRDVAGTTHAGWRRRAVPAAVRGRDRIRRPADARAATAETLARALCGYDARRRLPRVGAATLVVGGTRDALFPPPVLRETAERLPRGSVHLFEGAGNAVRAERRRAFDRTVARFLADMADVTTVERRRHRWTPAGL